MIITGAITFSHTLLLCAVWRQDELAYINQHTSGPERKAALCSLLEQEAQYIASIGRHKVVADQKNRDLDAQRFLDKVAS